MTHLHLRSHSTITVRTEQGAEAWRDLAACAPHVAAGDDPWWSDDANARARAVAICYECPVLAECAESSRTEPFGVWAGKARGWAARGRPVRTVLTGTCAACKRAIRAQSVPAADAPGTVSEGRVGLCRTCTYKGRS